MNETTILQNLEAIAEKLNIKVLYENLRKRHIFSKGGLCRVKDEHLIIVENNLHISEKIEVLASALSQFSLEDIYIPPAVRKILAYKHTSPISEAQEVIELLDEPGLAG